MKIEMSFKDVTNDIEGVVADIRIEDSSEADAPAKQFFSLQTKPFSIRSSQPIVIVDAELNLPVREGELSLFVRVGTSIKSKKIIKFLNTTATPLTGDPNELIKVSLERIE